MKIKEGKEDDWKEWVEKNKYDPYSKACVDFAEAWADAMEQRMDGGADLEQIANETCSEVDNRPGFGITGFMYGMVVTILADVWEHGETLRRWHNLETQMKNEGEKANERGSVLNPAIITLSPKK